MLESREAQVEGTTMAKKGRSLWGDAWRRLISSNTARLGMVIVATFNLRFS
jgi:hypothetical protein